MKKWKIAGVVAVFVVIIVCVVFCVLKRNAAVDTSLTKKETTSMEEQDVSLKMSETMGEMENQKESKNEGEVDAEEEVIPEEEISQKSEKSEKTLQLIDQIPNHGKLSEKEEDKLIANAVRGKTMVIRTCPEIETPEKMRVYETQKVEVQSLDVKQKLDGLVCEALKDNPANFFYAPIWVTDKYYNDLVEIHKEKLLTSEEEPFMAVTPSDTDLFILQKDFYDTRIPVEERFALTQKRAVKNTKKFLEKVSEELSLGCDIASIKTWNITGCGLGAEKNTNGYTYENAITENYYDMTISCTLDEYPIVTMLASEDKTTGKTHNSNYFQVQYSETGFSGMTCNLPHRYIKTKNYYDNLLSMDAAQKSVLKDLKKSADVRANTFGITDAQLGYATIKKEILRPVWILYGEKKGMGGGSGFYLVDAQNGQILGSQFE